MYDQETYWGRWHLADFSSSSFFFVVQRSDPFYSAAALHFDSLFKRYGHPIIVLNLVKVLLFASFPFSTLFLNINLNPVYIFFFYKSKKKKCLENQCS